MNGAPTGMFTHTRFSVSNLHLDGCIFPPWVSPMPSVPYVDVAARFASRESWDFHHSLFSPSSSFPLPPSPMLQHTEARFREIPSLDELRERIESFYSDTFSACPPRHPSLLAPGRSQPTGVWTLRTPRTSG